MNIDRAVLALAGGMTLVSVLLATLFSPWWLLLAVFAGLNQLQAAVTGVCPAAMIFRKAGLPAGCAFE
ncbi:MAG: YgaP family membrane protein [Nocardioides sp.]